MPTNAACRCLYAGYRPDGITSYPEDPEAMVEQSEATDRPGSKRTHPRRRTSIRRAWTSCRREKKLDPEGRPDNFKR